MAMNDGGDGEPSGAHMEWKFSVSCQKTSEGPGRYSWILKDPFSIESTPIFMVNSSEMQYYL